MTPRDLTLILLEEDELPPARAWARRAGVELTWDPDTMELRVVLEQRSTGQLFYLMGRLDSYKAWPPAWDFRDENWQGEAVKRHYPAPSSIPGIGSIFHKKGVICAPFNRLAYATLGGPHKDWGGFERWLKVAHESAHAETIGDMLALIARDMSYSSGRMQ